MMIFDGNVLKCSPGAPTAHPGTPKRFTSYFFGGHKAVVRPVPIPNTAVKHSLADGSGLIDSARVGCRQIILFQVFRHLAAH